MSDIDCDVGVGDKMVQVNRSTITDKVMTSDVASLASIQTSQAHKAVGTSAVTMYPASTTTDINIRHHASTETDLKIFQVNLTLSSFVSQLLDLVLMCLYVFVFKYISVRCLLYFHKY